MRGTKTIKKKQTIPEGYKQTAVGIIPKEWEVYEIGKLVSLASGGTPSRQIGEYWNGNIPWITTGLIKNGIIDTAEEYITELGLKNSSAKIFPAGTILMAMYGQGKTRGSVAKLSFEAATNQACAALMPRESTSRDFLFYYLKFNYENIRNLSNTGNQENLSLQLIRTIKVKHPPLPEQQKIAAILSTWDEAIEKTQSLIDQLRQRNKGLAQQLLTGKKRLKKLGTPWPLLKFSDFLVESRIRGTNGLHSKKITVKLYGKGVFPKEENRIGSKNTQYYVRHAGQFIYSKLDFLNGAFGLIPKEMDGFESTLDLPCFDIRTDRVNPSFLLRFACREEFYRKYTGGAIGGRKAKRVQVNEFLNIRCHFPSEEEQQAIAKVLEMAEKELSTHEQRLRILRQQKHGLMQKLLTGEIRVNA